MWLGITKYVKNSTAELPEEFKHIYDKSQKLASIPKYFPPIQLSRDGEFNAWRALEIELIQMIFSNTNNQRHYLFVHHFSQNGNIWFWLGLSCASIIYR